MSRSVTKAVIPVAGLGTRLRPLTDHMPKELLPVGEKPLIQYALEMYMESGISEFCVITSPHKPLLRDFISGSWKPPILPFRRDEGLYRRLAQCRTVFVDQQTPNGVAAGVSLARDFVGNEPFACIMPDCLLFSRKPFAQQLMEVFHRYNNNVIGTVLIRGADTERFGNVGLLKADRLDDRSFSIRSLSDKKRGTVIETPDTVTHKGFGGGIYLPEYFDLVELIRPSASGEVDDVPIHQMLSDKEKLLGALLEGTAFDAGHPLGFRAAVHYVGRQFVPGEAS